MNDDSAVTFEPWGVQTDPAEEHTLLELAENAGVGIESLCGGRGLCGTCKVIVDSGSDCLDEYSEADKLLLSDEQLARGYRLSCRASIDNPCETNDIEVRVPSVSQVTGGVVLTEGIEIEIDLDPAVRQYHLELEEPTLDDNVADRERLLSALGEYYDIEPVSIDHGVLQTLPNCLRSGAKHGRLEVTATVYDGREVVDLVPGLAEEHYGIAVDVGTTTIAAYLLDLRTGDIEAVSSRLNPQAEYGGDIMTRVRYSRNNVDGLADLQSTIIEGVNECIDEVTLEAGIDREQIYEGVFVGNTAMHHLFLGIEPSYVAGSPYVAANHAPIGVKAREIGVDVNDAGYLYWLPISGGWVGPDKVSVLLVSGHYREEAMTVCIDIGTNGEISVGNRDALWTTSAPAGPALEGAEITHGLRAQEGAIEHVTIDRESFEPTCDIIGDCPPDGICGSGVIDAVAELFLAGVIDRRGKFRDSVLDHPRIRRNKSDVREFVLVESANAGIDEDIVLTQNDIREIQMAKAAIQAGTLVLLDELGVDAVDRVVLAGGFGNYIDPESARTIGLYPDIGIENVDSLGNAAGIGAKLALLDRSAREEAERILEQAEYYEIAGTDAFRDAFLASMYLPHRDLSRYPRLRSELEAIRDLDDVPQP